MNRTSMRDRAAGFSLTELLITLVVVGILAGIGYPGYVDYVVRGNRQAARAMIYAIADRQEQFFQDNKSYATDLSGLGLGADLLYIGRDGQWTDAADERRTYQLQLSAADATSYTIEAEPLLSQAEKDTSCATLTLTSTGERTASGGGDRCW